MIILIHYGEIGLKGANRAFFEKKLVANIKTGLKDIGCFVVERQYGRMIVKNQSKVDESKLAQKLKKVFGIANFSFVNEMQVDVDMERIGKSVYGFYYKCHGNKKHKTFRIDTRRSDKNFSLKSREVNEKIGAFIAGKTKMKVDLDNPDITFFIEITQNTVYVYFEKTKGPGGLPVGVSGKVLSFISSGIDSPVAAWRLMKRGANVDFVHFHSHPKTSRASIDNVKEIVRILNEYQYNSRLYLIPFVEIQKEIIKEAPEDYRVIMYRYFMFQVAEMMAGKRYKAFVTGESLGQVASQTLDNIYALDLNIKMPVFRPLIGMDKEEIINEAKKIGTYDISIKPYDDCCGFFVPKHPVTKANSDTISSIVGKIDKKIIDKTFNNMEIID